MPTEFVRARCQATGAVAKLPLRALELDHIPGWVRADGPLPSRPKNAVLRRRRAGETETADAESASSKEE